jgi:hypothetical protein
MKRINDRQLRNLKAKAEEQIALCKEQGYEGEWSAHEEYVFQAKHSRILIAEARGSSRADYIAAANPKTVQALFERITVLETAMEEAVAACDECGSESPALEYETRLCRRCRTFVAILREGKP